MNPLLKKLLEATRLTQVGKLGEATTTIQRALAGTVASSPIADPMVFDGLVQEAYAPPAAAPGTPARPASPRFEASSYTGASGTRRFKLFEPGGAPGGLRPLVVMLHGCTQDPDDFAAGTRMNELAEAKGVFVLYPEQAVRSNANRCWNWFVPGDQQRGLGEPALIAGMTRHVIETHGIDPDRVYVAGLSAGGAMAAILAREYSDLYAAAGVHSGLPAGAAHDMASAFAAMKAGPASRRAAAAPAGRSAPVIVFHGSADTTVTPANGDAVIASALAGAPAAQRSDREGNAGAGRSYRQSVWAMPGAAPGTPALAEQWLVSGAPHAWSGGSATGSYTDAGGPDASAEMLRFFFEHPRQQR